MKDDHLSNTMIKSNTLDMDHQEQGHGQYIEAS